METVDCAVIGAGVVGLAIGRALAGQGREVIVIEAADRIGTGNSSRNSEVIHAGIYYPQGSLMARLCVAGRNALYAFCASHQVAHEKCGKLIVATNAAEAETLDKIRHRAALNGVEDLVRLTAAEARRLNPELACEGALLSPSTGVIDSHGYMLSLQADLESRGGVIAFQSPARGGKSLRDGVELDIGGADPVRLKCRTLVNSAGLAAPALARRIEGLDPRTIPKSYLAKGNYFSLAGQRAPFSQLIYPVPVAGGLGVHLTLDLAHQARFGPDVEWVEQEDYSVDPARAEAFYAAIRRYWPGLKDGALQPAYCGIRPKIAPPGAAAQDFRIMGPAEHGACGLVNLFGIESPGLTASLTLADYVADLVAASPARRGTHRTGF
ncbi:MAG: NAD(P)/FAD-dependent oxidoreductase [Methylocella sp.]